MVGNIPFSPDKAAVISHGLFCFCFYLDVIIVSSKALKLREQREQKTDCSSAVFGGKQKEWTKMPSFQSSVPCHI